MQGKWSSTRSNQALATTKLDRVQHLQAEKPLDVSRGIGSQGRGAWLIDRSGRIESQAGREQVAARDRFDRPDRYTDVLRSTMPCSVRVSMNA